MGQKLTSNESRKDETVTLDRNLMKKKGPHAGVSGQPGNPASYAPAHDTASLTFSQKSPSNFTTNKIRRMSSTSVVLQPHNAVRKYRNDQLCFSLLLGVSFNVYSLGQSTDWHHFMQFWLTWIAGNHTAQTSLHEVWSVASVGQFHCPKLYDTPAWNFSWLKVVLATSMTPNKNVDLHWL